VDVVDVVDVVVVVVVDDGAWVLLQGEGDGLVGVSGSFSWRFVVPGLGLGLCL